MEFYVGPPRDTRPAGPAGAGGATDSRGEREAPRSESRPPVQPPAWVRRLRHDLREDVAALLRKSTGAARGSCFADSPAAAQPTVSFEVSDAGYVTIRMLHAAAGAGPGGAPPLEHATVSGYLAFQRGWCERHAIDSSRCTIIGVLGDAMEPTLPDGCAILVDRSRRRLRVGHIFVLRTGDELVVRRALKDRTGRWLLAGDHHPQAPPVPWDHRESEVAGEVRWMAKTFAG